MTDPYVLHVDQAEFWQNPYPELARARAQSRTAVTSRGEAVVLRADDFDVVHSDPAFRQPGLLALERLGVMDGPFYEWRSLSMAAHDGEVHDRLRSCVIRAFTPKRVGRVRAEFDVHVRSVLAQLSHSESFDVVADFADDLPLWLICRFLGLPVESRSDIAAFLVGTEAGFVDPLTPQARETAEAGIVALGGFVQGLIAEREDSRRADLVSDLLDAEQEGRLNRAELVALVVNVLGGAIGSSRAGLVNTILLLLRHPEQAAWVASDPGRVAGAVEECLRYHPPFRSGRKLAAADNGILGVDVKAGETIYLARQSANRDPARWPDPDTFDVSRPAQRHYSFGYGPHFCVGQALARMDIEGAVAAFLERLPRARLLTLEPQRVPFTPDEQIRELLVAAN